MDQFTRLGGAAPLLAAACIAVGLCAGLTLPLHLIVGHARESDDRRDAGAAETPPTVPALLPIGGHAGGMAGDHQDLRPAAAPTASRSLPASMSPPTSAAAPPMASPRAGRGVAWRWRPPPVDALALFQVFLL